MEKEPRSKGEFAICGPVHLTRVDWRRPDHIRSVVASLVQGVYLNAKDHFPRMIEHKPLAPIWWNFFHFRCVKNLVDPYDYSIFGSIFEYQPQGINPNYNHGVPPRYVIAFRGTLLVPETYTRDMYLNSLIPLNTRMTQDPRYQKALHEIKGILNHVNIKHVLLAGHSLGAAIALQAGKEMAKEGYLFDTYLFNPPHPTLPTEMIKDPYLRDKFRNAKMKVKAGLHRMFGNTENSTQFDPFLSLCSWYPKLFVNKDDPLCNGYIPYFESRGRMDDREMESIVAKNSLMSILAGAMKRGGEPLHLLPSVLLIKNILPVQLSGNMKEDVKIAHCLAQWWQPHQYWDTKLYIYEECNCM